MSYWNLWCTWDTVDIWVDTSQHYPSISSFEVRKDERLRNKKAQKTTSASSRNVDVQQLKIRCMKSHDSPTAKESTSLDTDDTNASPALDNTRGSSSPNSSDLTVMTLRKKKHGGRTYIKKFYCAFYYIRLSARWHTIWNQNTKIIQKRQVQWHSQ